MTVEEYLVKRILELEGLVEKLQSINTELRIENDEYCKKLSKLGSSETEKLMKVITGEKE